MTTQNNTTNKYLACLHKDTASRHGIKLKFSADKL